MAHGLWSSAAGLLLWTETDERAGAPVPAGLHPLAVADPARLPPPPSDWSGPLKEALTPYELDRLPTLLLPTGTIAGLAPAPLPSPALRAPDAGAARGTDLAPWQVPACAVARVDSADLLMEVASLRTPSNGAWVVADELAFLGDVAAGVARWVYSGRVVPTVVRDGQQWRARWVLADDGPIRTWRTQVGAALPPVLRAEVVNGCTPSGTAVVDSLLESLCDSITSATLSLVEPRVRRPAHPLFEALDTGEPLAEGDAPDPARLSTRLHRWATSSTLDTPDVVFRLLEPPDDEAEEPYPGATEEPSPRWMLEACVRTADTAPVPLRSLPRSATHDSAAMHALGRAMAAYPPLRGHTPNLHEHVLILTTAEALDLVTTGAAALRSAGITVLLPRAWARRDPTLALRVVAPDAHVAAEEAALGMAQLLGYRWRMALGEVELTRAELTRLARAQAPLVRLRGEWVQVDPEVAGRAARYVAEHQGSDATLAELLAMLAGDDQPPAPVTEVVAEGWFGDLLAGRVPSEAPEGVGLPPGLHAELRPYQQRGLDWLAFMSGLGLGVVLADDMGLGKTLQLLGLLVHEQAQRTEPTLVVCPMSVVGNWQREAERFAPGLRVAVHHGPERARGAALGALARRSDLVLTTYQLLARDRDELAAVQWDRVVLDEAQHVKNSATEQARAARALPARHRVALTGTPVENRLEELRALLDFANPGMLGSPQAFRARFAVPIEREQDPEALARLRTATAPFMLRRVKSDPAVIADLPEKLEMTVRANLTVEQAALYQAVVDDMLATIKQSRGMQRKALVLSTLTRLKQVCNHPAHFLADGSGVLRDGEHRSGKLELVEDLLYSVLAQAAGQHPDCPPSKVLLFTQFTQFGELLAPWLGRELGVPVPFLHGGVSKGRRDRMVEAFQRPAGPPVMLLSLKAGGTGLNLTAANHVVHLDRWWNPAVENQATDRAFRIGQQRDVQVRKLVCVGTVEERIDALLTGKQELADVVVGAGETWLTELGTDELRALMTLGEEAVGE
ncbi:DEAD/DEAH box helicase [Rhodococcus sp. X156]|uniref:DEAD/DEAH box helicase n=1 Tax=Rhodococcus sp. X156 TaxID=2499145 RepID=UPI001F4983F7|nr:DEAD/DEAH box helicase [Rhodococcus sp. X156]